MPLDASFGTIIARAQYEVRFVEVRPDAPRILGLTLSPAFLARADTVIE